MFACYEQVPARNFGIRLTAVKSAVAAKEQQCQAREKRSQEIVQWEEEEKTRKERNTMRKTEWKKEVIKWDSGRARPCQARETSDMLEKASAGSTRKASTKAKKSEAR